MCMTSTSPIPENQSRPAFGGGGGDQRPRIVTPRRSYQGSPWTPALDAELLRLAALPQPDCSNEAISARLGFTPGQVAGRFWTLGQAGKHAIIRPRAARPKAAPGCPAPLPWPNEAVAWLREQWCILPVAQIARKLGKLQEAVHQKAKCLNLGPGFGARGPRVRKAKADPRPAHPPIAAPAPIAAPVPPPRPAAPPRVFVPPQSRHVRADDIVPPIPRVDRPPVPKYGRVTACCWPIGEPGTREFRFCEAASQPGRPYCETHVARAYVQPRMSAVTVSPDGTGREAAATP